MRQQRDEISKEAEVYHNEHDGEYPAVLAEIPHFIETHRSNGNNGSIQALQEIVFFNDHITHCAKTHEQDKEKYRDEKPFEKLQSFDEVHAVICSRKL
jgi:hypothetical protein